MKQIFADSPVSLDSTYTLNPAQAHHIFDVLRTGSKETVRVIWEDEVFLAHPEEKPNLYIFGKEEVEEPSMDITLAVALYKASNFEWMLQKAAELGVSRIVPFVSQNTIVRIDPSKVEKKLARWASILEAACNQSNRASYVALEPIQTIESLQEYKSKANLVAYENEKENYLANELADFPESITVVLGPEGGFVPEEIETLESSGFTPVSLGDRILRAETAAMYVLSAIDYQSHLPKEPDA